MKALYQLFIAVALIAVSAGCAKDSGGNIVTDACYQCTVPIGNTPVGTGNDPTQTGFTGSTAAMTSAPGLGGYFFLSRPYDPKNIRVNIDFNRDVDTVIISYTEGTTGRMAVADQGIVHPYNYGIRNNMYNKWYQENGQWVYKGFFQSAYGAIVLIINNSSGTGDGSGSQLLSGEIWYQNFEMGPPYNNEQGPYKMCWEISMGPFDCRSFLSYWYGGRYVADGFVDMSSAATPRDTAGPNRQTPYRKLGTFTGIDATAANFPDAY